MQGASLIRSRRSSRGARRALLRSDLSPERHRRDTSPLRTSPKHVEVKVYPTKDQDPWPESRPGLGPWTKNHPMNRLRKQ